MPFILLFWAIGLGMMSFAVNLGRRTAELVVEGNCLRIETKGLFGAKSSSWTRDEIAAIRADRSGMEMNHAGDRTTNPFAHSKKVRLACRPRRGRTPLAGYPATPDVAGASPVRNGSR